MFRIIFVFCFASGAIDIALAVESIDQLAPHAAAVHLCEVTSLDEKDSRGADGNFVVMAHLKPIRGSGPKPKPLYLVKAWGGNRGPSPEPPLPKILKHDSLEVGKRYWFVFASERDFTAEAHRVLKWWPDGEEAGNLEALESAVTDDRYKWSPAYHSQFDLTVEHLLEREQWQVRARRDGELLWKTTRTGKKYEGYQSLYVYAKGGGNFSEFPVKDGTPVLTSPSITRLDESNPYGVGPNAYIVQHYHDATNGKICATEVRKNQASSVIHGYFVYNPNTGNLISEQRNDWMPSGGHAVGADTDGWLRRIEKRYDEATGNVKQVKQMRYCNNDERKRFGGSHFVEITLDDQSTEAKQLDEK